MRDERFNTDTRARMMYRRRNDGDLPQAAASLGPVTGKSPNDRPPTPAELPALQPYPQYRWGYAVFFPVVIHASNCSAAPLVAAATRVSAGVMRQADYVPGGQPSAWFPPEQFHYTHRRCQPEKFAALACFTWAGGSCVLILHTLRDVST